MRKYIPCSRCENGWIIDKETEEATKCKCLKHYQAIVNDTLLIQQANLPSQVSNYDITQYVGEDKAGNLLKLSKYIEQFNIKFKKISLYIFGKSNTQKTTTIVWLGTQVAMKGFCTKYVLMNNLVKKLVASERNEELQKEIEEYGTADLLIVDESWDTQKVLIYASQFQLNFIDSFFRQRFNDKKATIFISNIELDDIDNKFGESLKSLVKRECFPLEFTDNISIKDNFNTKDLWG